jgi:predicted nicotinamide N-methyase
MYDNSALKHSERFFHGILRLQFRLHSSLTHLPSRLVVYDLPQLYTQSPASSLFEVLIWCARPVSSFSDGDVCTAETSSIDPSGVTRYLTSIISSPLSWIEDEDVREQIWEAASARISERSGRAAMPTMLRTFKVADNVQIVLREPSLTGDNLGLKTWTSSLLLARRLNFLPRYLFPKPPRVLELGAGTGLVGIAAACIWKARVTLTDLPEIVPNLQHNAERNRELVQSHCGCLSVMPLDWSDTDETAPDQHQQYPVILAADPSYSSEHPKLLSQTVKKWLRRTADAMFIVELPLREGYHQERAELNAKLREMGLHTEAE